MFFKTLEITVQRNVETNGKRFGARQLLQRTVYEHVKTTCKSGRLYVLFQTVWSRPTFLPQICKTG